MADMTRIAREGLELAGVSAYPLCLEDLVRAYETDDGYPPEEALLMAHAVTHHAALCAAVIAAEEAVQAERDACADICEMQAMTDGGAWRAACRSIAESIRKRGGK